MSDTPLVSVALCTYNGVRHLPAQLDSLSRQDYPNLEIVACDDGSTDGTLDILEAWARREPRLRVCRNPVNLGVNANFEHAARQCTGALIATCDQDDVWHPRKLSTLMAHRGNAALVYCDSELIDEAGRSLGIRMSDERRMYQGSDSRAFTFMNCVSGHALLATREVFQRASPFPRAFFYDWWVAFVATTAGGIAYVDESLVQFRQHRGSQTDIAGLKKPVEQRGARRHQIERQGEWIRLLRHFPGNPHESFFAELDAIWTEWRTSFICLRMTRFLHEHGPALYAMAGQRTPVGRRRRWQMLWGLRTREITQPFRYGDVR